MDASLPLRPGGSTFALALTPSASPGTLVDGPSSGDVTYVFDNSTGNSRAWIGYGPTSTIAQTNAVIPIIGTPSSALPVAKATVQAFSLTGRLFLAGIMETGSSTVTCIIGMGQ